jgi:aminoglycoside 3-N-acetyltransferase
VIRRAARRLPRPVRDALRRARQTYRSARYRVLARLRPVRLETADVEAALREAGVEEGDAVFVQAAMSAFGTFDDGPATVIEALGRVVGPEGLIAMPSFPLSVASFDYLAADPVFDVRTTPSTMGAISEAFRRSPGTVRSVHPTHPVAARGPGAGEIVAGHERATTPLGEGTPFPRLIERNAHQIFFGSGTGVITMYHSFECTREPPFPLDVFADRVFDARCVNAAREELTVRTLVHNPALLPGRIDANARLQDVFRRRLIDGAGARAVKLGRGEILALGLQPMLREFERLLADGITIYDAPLPAVAPTEPPQDRVAG